jgi:regulator of sigma E protease
LILLTSIAATVVVLGILIFIHELGHFLVAKWAGVVVLRFSLGFGPKLLGFQRGETEYRLSAVPLGGYVKMLGEENEEEVPPEQMERSFGNQSVAKRAAIVFAGPLSTPAGFGDFHRHLRHLAFIPDHRVGSITADSPAFRAGIQADDKVLEINGKPMANWDELSQAIQDEGKSPLTLKLQRGEQIFAVEVVPELRKLPNLFGESVERPVIGVTASGKTEVLKVNPLSAGYHSVMQTWNLTRLFFLTIIKLVQRVLPMDTLGGPILIAQMAGQQAQEGLLNLVYFLALISVNLAVLNLLPIPILDGGHLLFFAVEAVLRKPLSPRKIEYAQRVGLVLLIALMAIVFYNDIMRLMPGAKKGLMP